MSTENKNRFISSELEDLLKEVEEDHKKIGEIQKNKKNQKKHYEKNRSREYCVASVCSQQRLCGTTMGRPA